LIERNARMLIHLHQQEPPPCTGRGPSRSLHGIEGLPPSVAGLCGRVPGHRPKEGSPSRGCLFGR
jgi:hypothetical protein